MIASITQRLRPASAYTVAIIGGGASGAAAAIHLALKTTHPLRLVMLEPARRVGRGVAYSAVGEHLLLNVPAGKLSLDPDRPDDFLRWAQSRGRNAGAGEFLPRSLFGDYVQSSLANALHRCADRVEFERHAHEAVACWMDDDGRPCVRASDGRLIRADQVILALGHAPPRIPTELRPIAESRGFVRDPWAPGWAARVAKSARRVLFVGSGLTMLDAAITLDRTGFDGDMVAVSRRGLRPAVHAPSDAGAHADWAASLEPGSLRELTRSIRERAGADHWRGVLDALRPHTQRLWGRLGPSEQARAMRRLAVYWDAHRHRCPPKTAAEIESLRACGRLEICAAAIRTARLRDGRIEIGLDQRGFGRLDRERFDAVVLCTGPEADVRRRRSALAECLLESGAATAHPLGVGFSTARDGAAIQRDGAPSAWLTAIGSLRRGDLWESTAIPEISRQASDLARLILDRIHKPQHEPGTRALKEIGA